MDGIARPDDVVLRVATFNARHGVGRFGLASHRGLIETCRSLDADVLALQEVDRHVVRSWFVDQPASVARALAMRHVAAAAKRTPVGGSQCNAICARGSFRDLDVLELPRREGAERRIAVLANVVLAGAAVSVACTHLQHRGGGPLEQLTAVLEALGRRSGPRLVAGDFNAGPPEVEPLLAAHGFAAVASGPTFPAKEPQRRIDFIATDDGFVVVKGRVNRPLVSDHCPVVADLTVR